VEEVKIGEKVREFRSLRKMSVKALCEATGIAEPELIRIEADEVNPSIASLKMLALALGVPLWQFFRAEKSMEPVVRKNRRKTLGLPDSREVSYELLTPDTSGTIEFCEMLIPSGAASGVQPQCHNGEETAYVLEGTVQINVAGTDYMLESGDSIRIPMLTEHRWVNHSQETVHVLFAVTPPEF